MEYKKTDIKELVLEALDLLYENDSYLITHTSYGREDYNTEDYRENKNEMIECHVGERAIVFRYAYYLQNIMNDSLLPQIESLNLDCEYNRNLYDIKKLYSFPNGVYPDLIIHQRGSNCHNVLVMEFKTWWNTITTNDEKKLKEFTDKSSEYKYQHGVSILLKENKDDCIIKWFANGGEIND